MMEVIELKPLQREDFYRIVEWNKDKSSEFLYQWAGDLYEYPLTVEQIEKYFSENNANSSMGLHIYKIVKENTGEILGSVEIRKYEKEENTGRVGRFIISEMARGKGVGKKALSKLVEIGFNQLKYNKVCLGVFDFNKSAIACYEAVGFKKEGIIKKQVPGKEDYWNLYEMSISKQY